MPTYLVTNPQTGKQYRIKRPGGSVESRKESQPETTQTPNIPKQLSFLSRGMGITPNDRPSAEQPVIDAVLNAIRPLNPATPVMEGIRMVNRLPKSVVEPAAAAAGGFVGSKIPVPGSMSVGTGIGAGLGKSAVRFREMAQGQGKGDDQSPESSIREAASDAAYTGATTAVLSGALGLAGKGISLFKTGSSGSVAKIASRIRDAFASTKGEAGKEFEQSLTQLADKFPQKRISLRSIVDEMRQVMQANPKLESDIALASRKSGNTYLKDMLLKPELADDVTLEQAQAIKKTFDKIPSLAGKQGKFGAEFTDTDLDLLGYKNDIRGEMLKAFPELEDVYAKYADKIQAYRLLKNKFKIGSLVGNAQKEFGDPEVMKLVEQHLPKDAVNDVRLLAKAHKARETIGGIGKEALKYGVAGAGGGAITYSLLKLLGQTARD